MTLLTRANVGIVAGHDQVGTREYHHTQEFRYRRGIEICCFPTIFDCLNPLSPKGFREDGTMMVETIADLETRYPWIVRWENLMKSFEPYRNDQLRLAAQLDAPPNAIYRNSKYASKNPGKWMTTDDITNPELIAAWQLSCPACGGKKAKVNGCNNLRHEVYNA